MKRYTITPNMFLWEAFNKIHGQEIYKIKTAAIVLSILSVRQFAFSPICSGFTNWSYVCAEYTGLVMFCAWYGKRLVCHTMRKRQRRKPKKPYLGFDSDVYSETEVLHGKCRGGRYPCATLYGQRYSH